MFTDMVGYTALTQSNEALTMEVLQRHNRLLRPFFPRFNGREVKIIGDSFLVEFDSALDATRCAIEIQRFLHDYNVSSRDEWKIILRIAIHLGDVVHSGADILGDAVNIASRLHPLAEPEGVCISDQVFDQVRNKVTQGFIKLASRELKNVRFPVDVYKVEMPWDREEQQPAQLDSNRVAVLPFANMSPDPNDEYFADGMTEELIDRLAQLKGLKVIARTSVMSYKKKEKKVSEIAAELGVRKIVQGSVRKGGNRVRVTVQLIDAGTEEHLWSSRFERNLDDIFAVQGEVAESVAAELSIKLLESEKEKLKGKPTENTEAYTLYLKAKQHYHGSSDDNRRESISLLEQAVSKDPSFVLAYALLAREYLGSAMFFQDYMASVKKAEVAAKRALELGPEYAEAHAAMGEVHMWFDRLDDGRREMERAIEINPNLSEAYVSLSGNHTTFGKLDDALSCALKACDLDPLSYDARASTAWILRIAGRVDDALYEYNRLRELGMYPVQIHINTFLCHLQKGDLVRAVEELTQAMQISPDNVLVRTGWGMLNAKAGRRREAEAQLEEIAKNGNEDGIRFSELWVRTSLGDLDQAFVALMRLAELHSWPNSVRYDPLLQRLSVDPRFVEFCTKVGLPT